MKYFKNVEISKMYGVSLNAVGHWVEGAKEGKVALKVVKDKDRFFILNTQQNLNLMQEMTDNGKKYKNKKAFKIITPTKEFYSVYTPDQIADIIKNIELYKEIPHKYAYIDGGADYWDRYCHKMLKEESNNLSNTISLFNLNAVYIEDILKGATSINIIDLGPGNGFIGKNFIKNLYDKGLINKYIAIDFSKDMLDIVEKNFITWFGKDFPVETHIKDLYLETFQNLVLKDSLLLNNNPNKKHITLVLFLGGTIDNLLIPQKSLELIKESLSRDDVVILTKKLDTKASRMHFDFYSEENDSLILIEQEKIILDHLNILPEYYDVIQYFDKKENLRLIKIILKIDLEIQINTKQFKTLLYLKSKDQITLLRVKHQKYSQVIDMFDQSGLEVISASLSKDKEEIMVISKLKNL